MDMIYWTALVLSLVSVALNVRLLWRDRSKSPDRIDKHRKASNRERVVVRYLCPHCAREVNFAVCGDQVTCSACCARSKLDDWRRIMPERPKTIPIYEHESFKSKGKRA